MTNFNIYQHVKPTHFPVIFGISGIALHTHRQIDCTLTSYHIYCWLPVETKHLTSGAYESKAPAADECFSSSSNVCQAMRETWSSDPWHPASRHQARHSQTLPIHETVFNTNRFWCTDTISTQIWLTGFPLCYSQSQDLPRTPKLFVQVVFIVTQQM